MSRSIELRDDWTVPENMQGMWSMVESQYLATCNIRMSLSVNANVMLLQGEDCPMPGSYGPTKLLLGGFKKQLQRGGSVETFVGIWADEDRSHMVHENCTLN